ncbi:hypothetical protein [Catenulispora pinisilvae]|uniref:hypothetical protein n=1 Tax=Catenulispora pinisilvae TaxID=2705253 RepID=UPI00189274C0|nr:hypothetical protein [Catenulispora pinisilvae]
MTIREDGVSGLSYAESGEPRGYTRWLLLVGGLASSLTVNAIMGFYLMRGGVR